MIRVRFAPSPTGHLHVGAARTALFNWLFARRQKGVFILRIEDTDFARSSEEMSRGIMEGMEWLGLDWDEGPVYQSERLEVYRQKAEELVRRGLAYYCTCLPGEIEKRREDSVVQGKTLRCDCRHLHPDEAGRLQLEAEGRKRAIRFLVPDGKTRYTDQIHGPITVENGRIEDFVLLRGDGFPTYHLSVVVDDIASGITHIIRGDDHISNTPKQVMLNQAFGAAPPSFAHLALILGPDRKKLSKRHGVTSLLHFRDLGYLPLAMFNFLAQMSWKPGEEERIYTVEEMVGGFFLDKVSKGSPIFDLNKLDWLNGRLISGMTAGDLAREVKSGLKSKGLWSSDLEDGRREWFHRLLDLLKERGRTIQDVVERARPFLSDNFEYEAASVAKHLTAEGVEARLSKLQEDFSGLAEFDVSSIEAAIRSRAEKEGIKAAQLIHPLRVLVTGAAVSPGIFDVLEIIGRERTIERLGRLRRILGTDI